MTIVKGTKQYPVKVVVHRPFRRWCAMAGLLLGAVGSSAYCYYLGHKIGLEGQVTALNNVVELTDQLKQREVEVAELEQRLANIDMGAEVDKQANEEVRQQVLTLKGSLAKLQEENTFYRGLMAPTKNKRGLTFGTHELTYAEADRVIRYKIIMQQLATNHQLLKGSLQYTVTGKSNGLDVAYRLDELSDQVDTSEIKLRFKYFQMIEGAMKLPDGFEPERIDLVAKTKGKNSVTVEKKFGWFVEEA